MQINSYPKPIRITWQMQMWRLAVYMLLCSLFVADLIVGMEELELHYRRRGRYNLRKLRIATISVRMVLNVKGTRERKFSWVNGTFSFWIERSSSFTKPIPKDSRPWVRMNTSSQRAPKGPPNEDPPKSGLRVSVSSFSSLRPAPRSSCLAISDRCQKHVFFPLRWAPLS